MEGHHVFWCLSRKTVVAKSAPVPMGPSPSPFRDRRSSGVTTEVAFSAKTRRGSLFFDFYSPATRPGMFSCMHFVLSILLGGKDYLSIIARNTQAPSKTSFDSNLVSTCALRRNDPRLASCYDT